MITERLIAKHAHVKKLFSSVSRMAMSGLNLMENHTVRHNQRLIVKLRLQNASEFCRGTLS